MLQRYIVIFLAKVVRFVLGFDFWFQFKKNETALKQSIGVRLREAMTLYEETTN